MNPLNEYNTEKVMYELWSGEYTRQLLARLTEAGRNDKEKKYLLEHPDLPSTVYQIHFPQD